MDEEKKMKIILLPWMAFLIMSSAYGFNFTEDIMQGFYWEKFPLKIRLIVRPNDDKDLLVRMITESENVWEDALGINLWDIEVTENTTDLSGNYIINSDEFYADTGYDSYGTLAVTIRYNQGTFLSRVQIIINNEIDFLRQNFTGSLYKTIVHEFGHIIGLDHSEEEAIMAPYIGSVADLQDDDVEGGLAVVAKMEGLQATAHLSSGSQGNSTLSSGEDMNFGMDGMPITCGSIELLQGDDDDQSGPKSLVICLVFMMMMMNAMKQSAKNA